MSVEMPSKIDDVRFVIERIYSGNALSQEDHKNLDIVKQVFDAWESEEKKMLLDVFFYQDLPFDNLVSLYFYLLDISGDQRFLKKLDLEITKIKTPADFYEVFFNLSRRNFIGRSGFFLTHNLRCKYQELGLKLNSFINDRMLIKPKKVNKIKRIAILSPQILGMRHSPTREAFSLACHLRRNHDVDVYIINTNSLVYDSKYGINDAFIANVNRSLLGEQEIVVDYLDFKQEKLKLFSWPAERMSLQKIIDIQDVLQNLNVDAIISHAENLFVQEACYGKIPSLFVTTGGVVPFAHSDGYWIPGNLMTDEHRSLAATFGHFNFISESMIVTPEGVAEAPASRKLFHIPNEAFIYLIVSTRLNNEMDAEFASVCIQLLEKTPKSVMLFVGSPSCELEPFFSKDLVDNKRVINGGFCENLAEVCLMSNVYLNPNRQGGGTSSQTAMLNGLPIVTLDYGHISAVVPESYRHRSWEDYKAFAIRLYAEPEFLKQQQQVFLLHFQENLKIDEQVEKIYKNLILIAQNKYALNIS